MTLVLPETLTVERPAEVIDLRRAQVEFWSRNDALPLAIAANGVRPMPGHTVAEGAAAHVIWMRNTLQNAELYWVSPDMVKMLQAVALGMPDVHPRPTVPRALVVFAMPMLGHDARSGAPIHAAAYLWGPVTVLDMDCVEIEALGWRDYINPPDLTPAQQEQWRALIPTRLVATGGSEWPEGCLTSDFSTLAADGAVMTSSMLEDRRVMAAFWQLCEQRVTVETQDPGDRHVRRRAERAGMKLNPVRVITLRKASRPVEPEGTVIDWTHRWVVGGHWRQQPWGPRRELRRAQWIQPFVKGPADKPLVVRETVRALRR
jgi:hypothetical protein